MKSGLVKQSWLNFAGYSQIPKRAAATLLSEQINALEPSLGLIQASLLPDDQKVQYEEIIRRNTAILSA